MKFVVTEKAMRPASPERCCFYCHQAVRDIHKDDCILVKKKVMVEMRVQYEIEMPADWLAFDIEFNRNDGTWCADNAVDELQAIIDRDEGCLCNRTEFRHIKDTSEPYLKE